MLVKLANNIYLIEAPKEDKPSVHGKHMIFGNYAHPGVVAGGILGNFAGSEIGGKLFPSTKKVVPEFAPRTFMGMSFGKKQVGMKIVEEGSRMKRFLSNNVLRGTAGAIGAGLGATMVAAHNKKKDEQP